MCSGSVVVTAYDFKSGHPGSNPEWGPMYYKASITAQGLPEPSSLRDGYHWVPEQLNIKAVTGPCKLIDGCSPALCSATVSVISAGICHRNKVNSLAWLVSKGSAKDSILCYYYYYKTYKFWYHHYLSHHESYQSDHKSFTFKFFSHIRPTIQCTVIQYRSFKTINIDNFKSNILFSLHKSSF